MFKHLAMLVVSTAVAGAEFVYTVTYLDAYDADTIKVMVQIWPDTYRLTNIRLTGIDAPEIRGKCPQEIKAAIEARDYVRQVMTDGKSLTLAAYGFDKYGRMLGEVDIDGRDLGAMLLEKGMARPYDGGKRSSWCDVAL